MVIQCIKRIFASLSKVKCYILLQQVGERVGYLAKVFDKSPVKSCMSKKRSNLFHRRGVRQLWNNINFSRIYRYTILGNNGPKTIPCSTIKWHFSKFKTRLVSSHLSKTLARLDKQWSKDEPYTLKSSTKTSIQCSNKSVKILIIHRWNVPGALQRPNGIFL